MPTPQTTIPLPAAPASPLPTPVPRAARAPELRLAGERITLPLVMVGEYPFVQGEVGGVRGLLMLDTGSDQALSVNDHRVPLAGAVPSGGGHFGSGQHFALRLVPRVYGVRIGGLRYPAVTVVPSQDARQLEAITPDFLGFLGYYYWQGYALKLDYRRRRATFYRGGPKQYLAGEHVLARLPFTLRKLPNHPLLPARLGDVAAVAALDTGQYGALYTDAETRARLLQAGVLRPARPPSAAGTLDLTRLELAGRRLPGVAGLSVETDPFPAAAPIGLAEPTVLSLGYGFLRGYKTVWDYRRQVIYLLAR